MNFYVLLLLTVTALLATSRAQDDAEGGEAVFLDENDGATDQVEEGTGGEEEVEGLGEEEEYTEEGGEEEDDEYPEEEAGGEGEEEAVGEGEEEAVGEGEEETGGEGEEEAGGEGEEETGGEGEEAAADDGEYPEEETEAEDAGEEGDEETEYPEEEEAETEGEAEEETEYPEEEEEAEAEEEAEEETEYPEEEEAETEGEEAEEETEYPEEEETEAEGEAEEEAETEGEEGEEAEGETEDENVEEIDPLPATPVVLLNPACDDAESIPTKPTLEGRDGATLNLAWKAPSSDRKLLLYHVEARSAGGQWYNLLSTLDVKARLPDLSIGGKVFFRVVAVYDQCRSPSTHLIIPTKEGTELKGQNPMSILLTLLVPKGFEATNISLSTREVQTPKNEEVKPPTPVKKLPKKVNLMKTPGKCAIFLGNKASIAGNPNENQIKRHYSASPTNYFIHGPEKKHRTVSCPGGTFMRFDAFSLRHHKNNEQVYFKNNLFKNNRLTLRCTCKKIEPHCSFKAVYQNFKGKRNQLVYYKPKVAGYRENVFKQFHVAHRIYGVKCVPIPPPRVEGWYKSGRVSKNQFFMRAAPQRKKFRSVTCPKGKRMQIKTHRNRPGWGRIKTTLFGGRQLGLECRCDPNERNCSFKALYKNFKGKRHQLVFSGKGKLSYRRPHPKWAIAHGIHFVKCV